MSRNKGNCFAGISIAAFALLLGCLGSAYSETADQYFELGKKDLTNHAVTAAHSHFSLALSVDPNHQGANCFYALTSILMISNSTELNTLLDRAGVPATGRDIFDWSADFPHDAYGNIALPSNTPTGAELQSFAANNVFPVVIGAMNNLSKVGSSFQTTFNWDIEKGVGIRSGTRAFTTYTGYYYTNELVGYRLIVDGSEYDIVANTDNVLTVNRDLTISTANYEYRISAPLEIDYGDVLAFRGGLNLLKAGIYIVMSYNLSVDLDTIVSLTYTHGFDIQTHIIQAYPQLLTLLPTNKFPEAKASVRESIVQLGAALDSITGESDAQNNDLLIVSTGDAARFSEALEEYRSALDRPVFISGLKIEVDLSQFFDHPRNLRDYLPTFSGTEINPGSFGDPTFGGVLPTMTEADLELLLDSYISGGPAQVDLTAPPWGAVSANTLGPDGNVVVGYSTVTVRSGEAPYGTAVFSYTRDGYTISSEVGVPASPPTKSARFFVDSRASVIPLPGNGPVTISTGFAAVNPNGATANLTLKLRDSGGSTLAQGSIRLAPGEHIAKFLNQLAPNFVLPAGFINNGQATLEMTMDQPVSVLALRLTVNQREDVLLTSTPIADLAKAVPTGAVAFPQVADGGGYQTTLILMNTSGAVQKGVVSFYGNSGVPLSVRMASASTAASGVSYSIPSGGFLRMATDGSPATTNVGWAQLVPDTGNTTPVCAAVFGFTQRGILVTETGVPAVTPTTHARIYVDSTWGHDTGLAIANPGSSPIRITATAYWPDGTTRAGYGSGAIDLVRLGHDARFAGQFISGLPVWFVGVLDLASSSPFTALTLRSLNNARGDFLITTFPIADVNQAPPAPLIFPQIASGGGYQTQIILLNTKGAASALSVNYLGDNGSPIYVGR